MFWVYAYRFVSWWPWSAGFEFYMATRLPSLLVVNVPLQFSKLLVEVLDARLIAWFPRPFEQVAVSNDFVELLRVVPCRIDLGAFWNLRNIQVSLQHLESHRTSSSGLADLEGWELVTLFLAYQVRIVALGHFLQGFCLKIITKCQLIQIVCPLAWDVSDHA